MLVSVLNLQNWLSVLRPLILSYMVSSVWNFNTSLFFHVLVSLLNHQNWSSVLRPLIHTSSYMVSSVWNFNTCLLSVLIHYNCVHLKATFLQLHNQSILSQSKALFTRHTNPGWKSGLVCRVNGCYPDSNLDSNPDSNPHREVGWPGFNPDYKYENHRVNSTAGVYPVKRIHPGPE